MRIQDMTDEQFDHCVRKEPWVALENYEKIKNRLTDEHFDYCVREAPYGALKYYEKYADRITDEQLAYCISKVSLVSVINLMEIPRITPLLNDY